MYYLLYEWFIKLNIYTVDPRFMKPVEHMKWWEILNGVLGSLHFQGYASTQLSGAAWFVIVLTEITISFALLMLIAKHLPGGKISEYIVLTFAVILASRIGYILHVKNCALDDFLSVSFSCVQLYFIGYLLSKIGALKCQWNTFVAAGVFCVSEIVLYFMSLHGQIRLVSNAYPNTWFLLAASMSGWFLLMSFSHLISRVKILGKMFVYIGKRTMFILFLHFLGFKIVNALQVYIYDKPKYMIASFPTLDYSGAWWIVYVIVSIAFCLGIEFIWSRLWSLIKRWLSIKSKECIA